MLHTLSSLCLSACLVYSAMTSASLPSYILQSLTLETLKIRSKYLTPFLFFIFPWGLFVSLLSECQASAWVSKQTSSSRNDVSENCHWLGMSCQSLCWANDHCWVLWESKVSNSGHIFSSVRVMLSFMHVLLDSRCLHSWFCVCSWGWTQAQPAESVLVFEDDCKWGLQLMIVFITDYWYKFSIIFWINKLVSQKRVLNANHK